MKLVIIVAVAVMLSGCSSYMSMMDGLNKREVQTCSHWQGNMRAGSGLVANGSVAVAGITVTGGADIEYCADLAPSATPEPLHAP